MFFYLDLTPMTVWMLQWHYFYQIHTQGTLRGTETLSFEYWHSQTSQPGHRPLQRMADVSLQPSLPFLHRHSSSPLLSGLYLKRHNSRMNDSDPAGWTPSCQLSAGFSCRAVGAGRTLGFCQEWGHCYAIYNGGQYQMSVIYPPCFSPRNDSAPVEGSRRFLWSFQGPTFCLFPKCCVGSSTDPNLAPSARNK